VVELIKPAVKRFDRTSDYAKYIELSISSNAFLSKSFLAESNTYEKGCQKAAFLV